MDSVSPQEKAREQFELGRAFGLKYRSDGSLLNLNLAISYLTEAVEAARGIVDLELVYEWHLGHRLYQRFGRSKDLQDIDRAIEVQRKSLQKRSDDGTDPDRAFFGAALSDALSQRYDVGFNPHDLEEALTLAQAGVDGTPTDAKEYDSIFLATLEDRLYIFYEHFAKFDCLERLVSVSRERLRISRESRGCETEVLVERLDRLRHGLVSHYDATRSRSDLDEALALGEEALNRAPPTMEKHFVLLAQFGNMRKSSALLDKRPDMLDELKASVCLIEQAAKNCPAGHSHRTGIMVNLMLGWYDLYENGGDLADIRRALGCGQQVLDLMNVNDRSYPMNMHNVSIIFKESSNALTRPDLLDRAIQMRRDARK